MCAPQLRVHPPHEREGDGLAIDKAHSVVRFVLHPACQPKVSDLHHTLFTHEHITSSQVTMDNVLVSLHTQSEHSKSPQCTTMAAKSPQCITMAAKSPQCITMAAKSPQCITMAAKSPQCITMATKSPQCITMATKSPQCITMATKSPQCTTMAAKYQTHTRNCTQEH